MNARPPAARIERAALRPSAEPPRLARGGALSTTTGLLLALLVAAPAWAQREGGDPPDGPGLVVDIEAPPTREEERARRLAERQAEREARRAARAAEREARRLARAEARRQRQLARRRVAAERRAERNARRIGAVARPAPVVPVGLGDAHRRYFELRFRVDDAGLGDSVPAEVIDGDFGPELAAVARDDRFFVHFALDEWSEPPVADDPAAIDDALAALQAFVAEQMQPWWFVGGAEALPGRALQVQPAARCHVVEAIRAAVPGAFPGVDPARVRVGRLPTFKPQIAEGPACDVEALDCDAPPEAFSAASLEWHLDRLDPQRLPIPTDERFARVALVDTGFDAAAVQGDLRAVNDPYGEPLGGGDSDHGTRMGLLVRQLLPPDDAQLVGYPVFDAEGNSTPHDLAAGLAAALAEPVPAGLPLVINLSVGWAPELSQDRFLFTHGAEDPRIRACDTVENGAGESVRDLLDHARALDDSGARRISVFAATGNRPDTQPAAQANLDGAFGVDPEYGDPCLEKVAWDFAWFFPAEYGFTPTCDPQGPEDAFHTNKRVTAVGVGATGPTGARAALDGTTPLPSFLNAPGENVFVDDGFGPREISGTSVSTALTAAAAAYLHGVQAIIDPAQPLDMDTLVGVLYMSGVDVLTVDGPIQARSTGALPMRRISVCRGRTVLRCPAPDESTCPGGRLARCLAEFAPPVENDAFSNAALIVCGGCVEQCAGALALCDDESTAVPAWTPEYACWFDGCAAAEAAPGETLECVLDDGPCPFEVDEGEVIEGWYATGQVTSQPGEPGCEECMLIAAAGESLNVALTLNSKLAGGTEFLKAYLVVDHQNGKRYFRDLNPGGSWQPGQEIYIKDVTLPAGVPAADWSTAKATLYSVIRDTKGVTWSDWSPLAVTD